MAAGERAPRRRLRVGAGLVGLLAASVAGLAMFGTLAGLTLSNYFLSNYTQHHGIPDSGRISNVSNTRSSRGSWSAAIQITLDRPVDGATSTTLTVGDAVNTPDGTPVTVLVDPRDPAHAEYPGRPTYPLQVTVIFLSLAGVSALLFIVAVWRLAVIRYRNRGLPPPPAARHRHATRARGRAGGLPPVPREIIAAGDPPGGLLWAQLSSRPCWSSVLNEFRRRCTMQVCTIAFSHTAFTASGRPFSPSQTCGCR
jgi:hypothetical protein